MLGNRPLATPPLAQVGSPSPSPNVRRIVLLKTRRITLAVLGACALTAALAVPATGQDSASSLIIKGGVKVVPGKSITDNQRFSPSVIRVTSGSTLRISNRSKT